MWVCELWSGIKLPKSFLTLEGPPSEAVKRTVRKAMTTTSLCSNSSSVLEDKSIGLGSAIERQKESEDFGFTLAAHRASGQRIPRERSHSWSQRAWRSWSTEREAFDMNTSVDQGGYIWWLLKNKTTFSKENLPVFWWLFFLMKMVFEKKVKSMHTCVRTKKIELSTISIYSSYTTAIQSC